jgi:predicted MPP superfamily phosphohydrolase
MTVAEQLKKDPALYDYLVKRVGKAQVRRRIGIETDHAADRFGQGRTFFHIENWHATGEIINFLVKAIGLQARGRANALDFQLRSNNLVLPHLPEIFDGFTLLHLSDLHLDAMEEFPDRLAHRVADLNYDICVLTGDYRFRTHGPHQSAMAGLQRLREEIDRDIYAILGNHDTLLLMEPMEAMGIRVLFNENIALEREGRFVYLAGTDDPHYFATDNLEKAYDGIPDSAVSILLTHSPEIYRHAAYVGFDVMLCGHTHGGQICLPGSIPLTLNSSAPRFTGRGAWTFDLMQGYTSRGTGSSVAPVRFNCPPEITLHTLSRP